ncbi:hypothetical protein [Natronorubrum thiooxidans]|uniref:hypothetical protein n=1 Tax=Natronorubrum thiooxidans TaxID=308853 RepID=UPI001C1F2503|nr:hypothetical protein [Natronorubrum thiooxidans]
MWHHPSSLVVCPRSNTRSRDAGGIPDTQKTLLADPDARHDERAGMGVGIIRN